MLAPLATSAWLMVATLTMADGTTLEAVDSTLWHSYDECQSQADADAKLMGAEVDRVEATLDHPVIVNVSVQCLREKDVTGWHHE